MSEPFLGQVMLVGFNFAPRGWAFCDGQILSIAQNTALFSLLGTTYGGDGRTTFALPDLRGRVPVHAGTGPGLPTIRLGQRGGTADVALSTAQMPPHNHAGRAVNSEADAATPEGNVLALATEDVLAYSTATPDKSMDANSIANTGGGQSHNNMQPYLGMNYVIALVGLYPSRS